MTPAGIEPATFRFVAQHLNHCATVVPVASRHWHICKNSAVCWILKSLHKTNTCTYFKLVLSHAVRYRRVSTAVAIIIRVIYTITVSPNKLLKCVSETLSVINNVSNLTPKYTGLFEMIVGVLTTCHTQYTWDSSICVFLFNRTILQVFVTYLTGALYVVLLNKKIQGYSKWLSGF